MRMNIAVLLITLIPPLASAGELFGSVSDGGHALANTKIELQIGGKKYETTTDAQGSYRLFAEEKGKGQFFANVPPKPVSADVFSSDHAVRYDWNIESRDGQKTLRRK